MDIDLALHDGDAVRTLTLRDDDVVTVRSSGGRIVAVHAMTGRIGANLTVRE